MAEQQRITAQEWRRVGVYAFVLLVITTLPYLVGWLTAGDSWVFSGFVFGTDDGYSYLSKMALGARGEWLFRLRFTAEPHAGVFLYLPHIALGQVTGLLVGADNPGLMTALAITYHAARIAAGVLLVLVSYRFAAVCIADPAGRMLALVLITAGGGLGWLLVLLGQGVWLGSLPLDFFVPEAYTFLALYGLPHLALARAALLAGLLLLFAALRRPLHWQRQALGAGACWLVMGLCVPFYVAVVYMILGVWGLAAWARRGAFPWALFWRAVTAAVIALPALVYSALVLLTQDVFGAWASQNTLPSPHPLHYVLGYGVLAVPAAVALRPLWRRGNEADDLPGLLLVAWVFAALVMVYLPIGVQRRLGEGVIVPLSVLAVLGLRQWFAAERPRRIATGVVLALALPTTLFLVASGLFGALTPDRPLFRPQAELDALDRVATQVPADAVLLCDRKTGSVVPVRTGLVAYVGHGPETLHAEAKERQVAQFYAGTLGEDARRALLETVDVVFFGPLERAHTRANALESWMEGLRLLPGFSATDEYRAYAVIR